MSSAIVPPTPSERSQIKDICFFLIIARRRETEEHPPSSFSLSKRVRYKNEKKRKEKKCASSERHWVLLSSAIVPPTPSERSQYERKALFSSSSLDFENAPSFHAALPREKRKTRHTKRKEKTRTLKNTPPFLKMLQHDATKKVEKLFFCSFFLRKNRRRESRGRPCSRFFLSHLNA